VVDCSVGFKSNENQDLSMENSFVWECTRIILTLELRMRHFLEVMWEEYEPEWEKRLPQLAHSNGFSPE
jgi:hypothetical protein